MLFWALVIVGSLIGLLLLMAMLGAFLPRGHVITVAARYAAGVDELWAAIADPSSWPSWNTQVRRIERSDRDGREIWIQHGNGGKLPTEVLERSPPAADRPGRLVTRIDDRTLPFGGTWTWEVTPAERGASVSITEDGWVSNTLFRFLSRFVFGHHATARGYLRVLGKKFGETVTPEIRA